MRRLLPLVFLLSACTAVGGDPVPAGESTGGPGSGAAVPTSQVTSQADVTFRPVEEVVLDGQPQPPTSSPTPTASSTASAPPSAT
ncbi:hypothetical protein ACFQV2_24250 [Actinokineospora soli]|uniref:Uncharacterized protein n=1 Tax=Actinokineospora soli TaxID=1048753 RepID=A0ABW2TQN6_9PSEU